MRLFKLSLFPALFLLSLAVFSGTLPESFKPVQEDSGSYLTLARHIADDNFFSLDGVTPTAAREPLYPILLGLMMKVNLIDGDFGSSAFLPLVILQIFFTIISLILLRNLFENILPEKVLGFTFIVIALYLPLSQFALQILSESLYILLIVSFFYTFLKWQRSEHHLCWLGISALILGCACITKSVTIPFIICISFVVLLIKRWPAAMLFLCLSSLLPGLWILRHHHQFDRFIMSTTDGGSSLYRGNLILGTMIPTITDDRIPVEVRRDLDKLSSEAKGAYLMKLAVEQIKSEPLIYIQKCFYKAFYLLFGYPEGLKYTFLFVVRMVLVALLLFGLIKKLIPITAEFWLIMLFSLYIISIYSAIYATPRYFAPCLFLLFPYIILCASRLVNLSLNSNSEHHEEKNHS